VDFVPGPGQPPPWPLPAMTYAAVAPWSGVTPTAYVPWGRNRLSNKGIAAEIAVCLSVPRSDLYPDETNPEPVLVVYGNGDDPRLSNPTPLIEVSVSVLKSRTATGHVKEFSNFVFVIEE